MSLLKLIKETDIKRGRMIGSGAFGTVYEVRHTALCSTAWHCCFWHQH